MSFSDMALTMGSLLQESLPDKDVHKNKLVSKNILILQWFMFGFLLSLAYTTTLPSFLMSIRYEDTIDTISDQETSDTRLIIIRHSPMETLLSTDPRPSMQNIYNKSIGIVYDGRTQVPQWIDDM